MAFNAERFSDECMICSRPGTWSHISLPQFGPIIESRAKIVRIVRHELERITINVDSSSIYFTIVGTGVRSTNNGSSLPLGYEMVAPYQNARKLFRDELNGKQNVAADVPSDGKYFAQFDYHENLKGLLVNARCALLMSRAVAHIRDVEPYSHWKGIAITKFGSKDELGVSRFQEADRNASLAAKSLVDINAHFLELSVTNSRYNGWNNVVKEGLTDPDERIRLQRYYACWLLSLGFTQSFGFHLLPHRVSDW